MKLGVQKSFRGVKFCTEVLKLLKNSIIIQSMTPNCRTFFNKKLQKGVTIWEHFQKGV